MTARIFGLALAVLLTLADSTAGEERAGNEERPGPPARRELRHAAKSFRWEGRDRRYGIYVPMAVERRQARVPAVFVLHGAMGDIDRVERYLGFNEVAEAEGFIVVYPEGLQGGWDDGRPDEVRWRKRAVAADDVGFLDALAAAIGASPLVDRARIYLTGVSNGGYMTTRMACDRGDRFAAFAPLLSSLPAELAGRCRPERPVPVLMINGTRDGLVPWKGIDKAGYRVLPVLDQARFWAAHNGCAAASEQRLNDIDVNDGSTVIHASWSGCRPGGAVEIYAIEGGGHQVPSLRRSVSDFLVGVFLGARNRDLESPEVIWHFFRRHRLGAQ